MPVWKFLKRFFKSPKSKCKESKIVIKPKIIKPRQKFALQKLAKKFPLKKFRCLVADNQILSQWENFNFEVLEILCLQLQKQTSKSIVSIGCGDGLLELLLSEEYQITAVDVFKKTMIPQIVRQHVNYCQRTEIYQTGTNDVLLFCFPVLENWNVYLDQFQGKCVIIICDANCSMYPSNFTIPQLALWKKTHQILNYRRFYHFVEIFSFYKP